MLKHNIPLLHARARARRNGLTSAALDLSTSNPNDFESLDEAVVTLLGSFSNPNTTTAVALTSASGEPPLEGLQSLRLSFEYRDEPGRPWAQWINLPLAFQGRPVDLSQREGIRLTLRTDGPRVVRVDLDSRLYEAGVEGIKFGWDVAASSEPLSVELRFTEASMPVWARATGDQLAAIRERVDALSFQPMCNGREAGGGLLPEGASDAGFLELDSIQVF